MFAVRLVQLIETHADKLSEALIHKHERPHPFDSPNADSPALAFMPPHFLLLHFSLAPFYRREPV